MRLTSPLDVIARRAKRDRQSAESRREIARQGRTPRDPHGLVSALQSAARLQETARERAAASREVAAHTYEVDLTPPPGARLERVAVLGAGGREVAIQYDPETRTAYPLRADSC